MNRYLLITAFISLLSLSAYGQHRSLLAPEIPQDIPSCINLDKAELRFPGPKEAQSRLYDKIDSMLAGQRQNVNIWHVGGSHVQAGHFTYRILEDLASSAPDIKGERGFLFPNRLAHTNSDKSFRTAATGEWTAPMMTRRSDFEKPRYGITGFGATTMEDDATVSLGIGINCDTTWQFNRLRLLGYSSSDSAYPYVLSGADTLSFRPDSLCSSYMMDFGCNIDTVTVHFKVPEGESFTLTGLQPISGRHGFSYYASGVNGAKLTNWLDEAEDLERDLGLVHPDLAVFGLSINDSACKAEDFDAEQFKDNYRRMIWMIRRVQPDCAFIFLTSNDSYRYVRRGMVYNENSAAVRKAMYELAEEFDAGVWDVFDIMGGEHSVLRWRDEGLIRSDKLHFTREGYILMGDLFAKALITDYND